MAGPYQANCDRCSSEAGQNFVSPRTSGHSEESRNSPLMNFLPSGQSASKRSSPQISTLPHPSLRAAASTTAQGTALQVAVMRSVFVGGSDHRPL